MPAPVSSVAFNRDGAVVAAASGGGPVEVWDPKTGKQLLDTPLYGHNYAVLRMAFGVAHQLARAAPTQPCDYGIPPPAKQWPRRKRSQPLS